MGNLENLERDINLDHVNESADRIIKVVEEQAEIFDGDYSKILVGGFSQGACVAYNTFYRIEHKIGGLVALSGYAPPMDMNEIAEEKFDIPIFR